MRVKLADVVPAEVKRSGDLIGHTSKGLPVFMVCGGESDDDPDDDDEEKETDEDDEEDDDETKDKDDEKERLRRTAKARKEEVKAEKERNRTLAAEVEELKKKLNGKTGDKDELDEETVKSLREEGAKSRDDYWKPLLTGQAAIAALAAAGYNGKNPARVVRLLDLDEVDIKVVDGKLTFDGLDDAVDDLKRENKDWFVKKVAGRGDGKETEETGKGTKRIADDDAAQYAQLGRRRR